MNDARSTSEFDSILDECLRDVLYGTRTIEQCLLQYPQYADDLKPALQVGVLTTRLKSPEMSEASIDLLEMRLRGQMAVSNPPRQVMWLPLSRMAAMIAIVFLVALGSGAGAVAASSNSVPGDWLYGLKRLWESIILVLTPLTGQPDDLWLQIAERRLDEVEELSTRGQLNEAALIDLQQSVHQAISMADAETTVTIMEFLMNVDSRLDSIQLIPEGDDLFAQIRAMTTPIFSEDGRLQAPSTLPAHNVPLDLPLSDTPSDTPAPTITTTPTWTHTPSVTPTNTVTQTPTPRVPATATRTPTLIASPTASVTPSMTPTATWTPLPLPTLPPRTPINEATQPTGASNGQSNPSTQPDAETTVRFRETEQSIYMTQTAGPPPATEVSP